MHLHVVAVAVAAVGLIAEQQVSVLLAEDSGQPLGGLVDVGPPEPDPPGRVRGELGVLRAVATVRISQAFDPVCPENRRARAQFGQPDAVVFVADPPVRGNHDDHPMARGRRPRQRAPGEHYLVVGVGVERDDGGHELQYAHRRKVQISP